MSVTVHSWIPRSGILSILLEYFLKTEWAISVKIQSVLLKDPKSFQLSGKTGKCGTVPHDSPRHCGKKGASENWASALENVGSMISFQHHPWTTVTECWCPRSSGCACFWLPLQESCCPPQPPWFHTAVEHSVSVSSHPVEPGTERQWDFPWCL